MKDERAEAGSKKKSARQPAGRAAKKAPAAAPRRTKTSAAGSNNSNNSNRRPARVESIATGAVDRPLATARRAPITPITEQQRQAMVAERAYFKAESRGFRGGDPQRDWYEAESEVDALILRGHDES
jgi:hypothetical protein